MIKDTVEMFGDIMMFAYENNASDIHLSPLDDIAFRIDGKIIKTCSVKSARAFSSTEIFEIAFYYKPDIDPDARSADFAFTFYSGDVKIRCRANLFSTLSGFSLAVRLFSSRIPEIQDLHVPKGVMKLIDKPHGLVLLAGPTGSGKSTTLAAMINHINSSQAKRIITIEDPVEYLHASKLSIIAHREVGTNCESFFQGFKDSLREDPDIILLGEIRDMKTMELAMEAAESGHLILSTVHSSSVIECLNRVIGMFPAESSSIVANSLSVSLAGIVSQKLLPARSGGRIAAYEVLINNPTIANIIKINNMKHITDYLRPEQGMISFDESIKGLRNRRLIE